MRMFLAALHIIICLVLANVIAISTAAAQETFSPAKIEQIQMPAWVKRNNHLHPLRTRLQLKSGDTIITGKGSRVLLTLSEGSQVKLGEETTFRIKTIENSNILKGLFSVISGAFRYTTNKLQKNQPRDLGFNIGAITVGIRGTDIWGKVDADKETLVLLEGEIDVSKNNQPAILMDTPLTHYHTDREANLQAPTPVDPEQLHIWAAETEPQIGQGIIGGGHYRLYLMSLSNTDYVASQIKRFNNAGYAVSEEPFIANDGNQWTRLYINGFVTEIDAVSMKQKLIEEMGASQSWIKDLSRH